MNLNKMVRNVYPYLTPYVAGLPDLPAEEIAEVLGLEKVYKLSFNENPLGPSPKAVEAMEKALKSLNLYPSSGGEKLKEALAKREGINNDQLILANGADELIILAAQTFLEAGDEVIIPQVTFIQYFAAANLMGASLVVAPMTENMEFNLDAILDRITDKTKAIFLCNPNNPTGTIIPKQEIRDFVKKVPDHILVVIDEAYHEYANDPEYETAVDLTKGEQPIFIVRTFSKIYSLAGARIGYGIGPKEIIDAINHVRPPFNVNGIAQAGALASLEDREHVAKARELNQTGKKMLYKAFEDLGLPYLKANGNFVYVDVGVDSQKVFDGLAERGIIVRMLKGYGLHTALRVSVGTPVEVEGFITVLKEVLKAS